MTKRLIAVAIGVLLIGFGAGLAGWSRSRSACYSPLFINVNYGPNALAVNFLIHQAGGLPKSNTEVLEGLSLPPSVRVYPVTSWEIKSIMVGDSESLWNRVRDDDPTYNIEMEVHVQYADESDGTLIWRTWRYGLLVCPLVVGYGDGPPGHLEWIEPKSP